MVILFGMEKFGFLRDEYNPSPEVTEETTNNVFHLGEQELAGDVGWEPVSEKSNEGGKG